MRKVKTRKTDKKKAIQGDLDTGWRLLFMLPHQIESPFGGCFVTSPLLTRLADRLMSTRAGRI